jgi:hypothetical protein
MHELRCIDETYAIKGGSREEPSSIMMSGSGSSGEPTSIMAIWSGSSLEQNEHLCYTLVPEKNQKREGYERYIFFGTTSS